MNFSASVNVIVTQHVYMCMAQWRRPGLIVFINGFALITQMCQRGLHINGIPEHDGIAHQPKNTQLLPLSIMIDLSELAFLPVTNGSGDSVSAFSSIKLGQDAAAIIFIINIIK